LAPAVTKKRLQPSIFGIATHSSAQFRNFDDDMSTSSELRI
jgi:hypothetical protein